MRQAATALLNTLGYEVILISLRLQPRVVNGRGAGAAVLQALDGKAEPMLSPVQLERLASALDALCRDVDV